MRRALAFGQTFWMIASQERTNIRKAFEINFIKIWVRNPRTTVDLSRWSFFQLIIDNGVHRRAREERREVAKVFVAHLCVLCYVAVE